MTRHGSLKARAKRYAAPAAVLIALGGLAALGTHQVSVESAQAQSLVRQARSELQEGRRAAAAVSLERAQLLAPRATFVRQGQRDAKVQSALTGPARVVHWLAPREWSLMLTAFGWAAGVLLALAIVLHKSGRAARRSALVFGLLFALSAGGFAESTISARALRVVSTATGLLMAPYHGAGEVADLQPGVVVSAGARYAGFTRVRGPSGLSGWVAEGALNPVVNVD